MISKRKFTNFGLPLWVGSVILLPFMAPSAAALVSVDQASLFFNGSATVRWDDNIFLDEANEESDMLFILSPGVELNIGTRTNANINLFYREDFYLYDDNSQLDSNQSNVFFESYWSQARLDLRLKASYQQLIQVTPEFAFLPGQLVERDYYLASLRGEYELTELTSIASGVDYSQLDFKTQGFSSRESVSVPVNAYYEVTPQVDLSLGYRYRYTDVDLGSNFTDHYFNVGARGELAPKLIGEVRGGYQIRDFQVGGDSDIISFGVDLSHFTTPRTTLLAGLYRDFDVGGQGQSITSTGGSLGVRHTFSHLVSGHAGVNYFERSYSGSPREDETLDLNVGVTYSPIVYLNLSANYIYRTNDSNFNQFEFNNNIFSLSAALRY
jgi:hypothetical protein